MRSRAAVFQEVASKALKTAFPVLAVIAIYYALTLALLNFMQALGNRFGTMASGVERVTHFAMWDGPAVIPALLGVFMLVMAYELWMRKRTALVVFCSFIVLQAAIDMFRGMSRGATAVTVMVAMVLALAVKQFPGRPDPRALKRFKVVAPALAVVFFTTGVVGLFIMRDYYGLRGTNVYGLGYKALTVVAGTSNLRFVGWHAVFRGALIVLAICGTIYVFYLLFRPHRPGTQTAQEEAEARRLVEDYGTDSLAYFNTRHDKNKFFYGRDSFIAYRLVGDVAVVSGDPVGPAGEIPEAIDAFREYCLERGWRFTVLGASGNLMPYYEEAGLKGYAMGEETIVSVEDFTLEGRDVRKLRQSVNKLAKAGYTMEFLYTASIPAHMKHDLERISVDWRGGKEETGFSMGLGRLMSSEDPDCLLAVAYDPEMQPIGFLHFVPMYPRAGYSLDVHRSRLDSPGALSEFMIAKTALFLKSEGYRQMSLHFLAWAQHYRDDRESPGNPFWRAVANVMDHFLPIVSVYGFDKKFNPAWKKRMLLHEGFIDLLVAGIVAATAESAFSVTRPSDRKK
jgi:lysyl-tRNA synthetase, class II